MPPKKSKPKKVVKSPKKSPKKSVKSVKSVKSPKKSPRTKIKKEDVVPDVDVDYDDEDNTPVDELADVPELYDIDSNNALKERYEYKPVVRQEITYLTADNRKTSEVMTQFEYTEIIGQRAKQIENGGPCFTDVTGMGNPIKMAEKELRDRKCPLDIIRRLSSNVAERWSANEMAFVAI